MTHKEQKLDGFAAGLYAVSFAAVFYAVCNMSSAYCAPALAVSVATMTIGTIIFHNLDKRNNGNHHNNG